MGALLGPESEAMGWAWIVPVEAEAHVPPQPRFVERDEVGQCSWCRQPTRLLALVTRQMQKTEPRLTADHVVACPPCAHACHDGGRRWERHLEALRRRSHIRLVVPDAPLVAPRKPLVLL
jgi:hypothetical protein